MVRRPYFLSILVILSVPFLLSAQTAAPRDARAAAVASQALQALTGGTQITDATLQARATFTAGSDLESGAATLEAHTGYESKITLILTNGPRSEVRNGAGLVPQGDWAESDGVWHAYALHNCWTDPTWFFPALTVQSALNDLQIAFSYVGLETKAGVAVQHIRVARVMPGQSAASTALIQTLSQMDIYIDAASSQPVALGFNTHPENDAGFNLPVEILFSGWRTVSGVQAPARIQKFLQDSLVLDLSFVSGAINSGVPQTDFAIQATAP